MAFLIDGDKKGRPGRIYVSYRDARGKQVQRAMPPGTSRRQAQRLALDWEDEAARQRRGELPMNAPEGGGTLSALMTKWLTATASASSATRNANAVRGHILSDALSAKTLDRVRTTDIADFIARKSAEGLAPQTVNHLRGFLSRAFAMAIERGWWAGENPVAKAKKLPIPEVDHDEAEWLRPYEARALLAQLDARWQPIFATAIFAGLRKGELRALRKSAVDLETGTIKVARSGTRKTTKSGKSRRVPIHPELLPYLRLPSTRQARNSSSPVQTGR